MPDQRSVMKEYRYLDSKRLAQGLSPEEELRYARLREVVGPEVGDGAVKPGFDVGAAAAQLRDSLVPAGLRNRPPPPPDAAAAPPAPEEVSAADALASVYAEQPFEPLEGVQEPAADALFDPADLGTEAAAPTYDPNAAALDPDAPPWEPGAAYDPNAPGLDPAAPAGWDPNEPLDPNAFAQDAAAPFDPGAAGYDPGAEPAWDPNQPWDPDAAAAAAGVAPFDPSLYPADPAGQPDDPAAPAAFDAAAEPGLDPNPPWDPNAFPQDAGAGASDPNAPYDPGAQPEALGGPLAPSSVEPDAAPELAFVAAEPIDAEVDAAPAALFPGDGSALPPDGWSAEPPPPEPPPAGFPLGEYDDAGTAPLGDPQDAGLDASLPFDAAAASAIPTGDLPDDYVAPLGEYDDTAAFGAAGYASGLAANAAGFEAAGTPGAPDAGWHPDAALDGGFQLASGGSFGAGADAAAPEWSAPSDAPPWENAPPLDVGAPHETPLADGEPGYELAPPPPGETFGEPGGELDFTQPDFSAEDAFVDAATPAAEPPPEIEATPESAPAVAPPAPSPEADLALDIVFEEAPLETAAAPLEAAPIGPPAAEDIPILDATDILEEIPADSAPPPRPLDFEPLVQAAVAPPEVRVEAAMPQRAAPPTTPEPAPLPAPPPVAARTFLMPGAHRVVVHTVEGQVKRGVLQDPDLAASALALTPQPGAAPEDVATEKVKAIFFMLAAGEKPSVAEGKKVRVTFRDGRQVAGFSPDYAETGVGFFMIPGDTRTNTGRIWVYRSSVRQVSVS